MRILIVVLSLFILSPLQAGAAANETLPGMVDHEEVLKKSADKSAADAAQTNKELLIKHEFWYILLLSVLCIATLLIVLTFLRERSPTAKDVVNAAGLTLIIFGTIILVMVVSTHEQLTAAIGILGAIAGYLFRSVQDQSGSADANKKQP
ncbi:MAG: hypothetical protein OEZ39_19185 [Gammaproteobacteria bacterium]|nr:hypothetical protein [Gammaproteobacteria bacterium]MDH5653990.1 hypothetical protein [Gammaproteobacteria bacterium]